MLPGGLARVMYGARDLLVRLVTGIDPREHVIPASAELETPRALRTKVRR
jgi:hypothetical protein